MWHTQGLSLGHSGRPCPPEEGVQRSAVNGEKGDSKVVAVDTRFTDTALISLREPRGQLFLAAVGSGTRGANADISIALPMGNPQPCMEPYSRTLNLGDRVQIPMTVATIADCPLPQCVLPSVPGHLSVGRAPPPVEAPPLVPGCWSSARRSP